MRVLAAANRMTLDWARRALGEEAARRAAARAEADGVPAKALEQRLGWVPFEHHLRLLAALAPEMGERRFFDLGYANAGEADRVVRVPGADLLLKLATSRLLVSQAPRLWRVYADAGALDVLDNAAGRARVAIRGVVATPPYWETLEGFLTRLVERAGGRSPRVLRAEEGGAVLLDATWT